MRRTTAMIPLLLTTLLAAPVLAQEEREEMKGHHEMKGEHMGMMMDHSISERLAAHTEELGLTEDQVRRFEELDVRLEAEKERHHAEMRSIHEAAMEILTPEQQERVHGMSEGMHGHGEGHGKKTDDDHDDHDDHDMGDDGDA